VSPTEAVALGSGRVELRDGSTVTIRPIAPDDKPTLLAGF
jgi:hypothetical protein